MSADELPASRELDFQVAMHVFGWRLFRGPSYDYDGPCESFDVAIPPTVTDAELESGFIWPPRGVIKPWYFCRKWSTDIAEAWHVVAHMRANSYCICMYDYLQVKSIGEESKFQVIFIGHGEQAARSAATFELAICRAALKILEKTTP